jgi:hypothetical protein
MAAYSDFTTISKVEKQFGLAQKRISLNLVGENKEASQRLEEDLQEVRLRLGVFAIRK